jgi:hypothetical protein
MSISGVLKEALKQKLTYGGAVGVGLCFRPCVNNDRRTRRKIKYKCSAIFCVEFLLSFVFLKIPIKPKQKVLFEP